MVIQIYALCLAFPELCLEVHIVHVSKDVVDYNINEQGYCGSS